MHRSFYVFAVLLLVLVLLVACGTPAATPTTAPAPAKPAPAAPTTAPAPAAPTAAPAAKAEPGQILLKYNNYSVPIGTFADANRWYLQEIVKRTNGKVKFEEYWSGSLIPVREEITQIGKGVGDLAPAVPEYAVAKNPLSTVGSLPGVINDEWAAMKAFWDLLQTPPLRDELKQSNVVPVAAWVSNNYQLISKKPVRTLADMKGLKVRALGSQAEIMQALGAVPVSMAATESYTALERGTTDGALFSKMAMGIYKLHEVAKNFAEVDLGGVVHFIIMNADTWNKLPPDVQAVFKKLGDEDFPNGYYEWSIFKGDDYYAKDVFPKAGVQFYKLSPEDKAKIREVGAQPLWDKWVKDMEAKKLPGKQVFDDWMRLYKQYEAKSPYKKS